MDEHLRYPIGKFSPKENYTPAELQSCIARIATLPSRLNDTIQDFSEAQLDTPYREGGWTVRQLIHHIADSHMNAYIRVKWTLTENSPVVKVYFEKLWAETPETKRDPALSLNLIKALHAKWVVLLSALQASDLKRHFIHPETQKTVQLDNMIALYAWHGDHHLAHITELVKRSRW